jgi:uncharacterized protein YuzE
MRNSKPIVGFELSVSGRDDGTVEALYITLSAKKVVKTREVIPDVLLVDYDSRGDVVGIEILAPVKISRVTRLVDAPRRRPLRRFIEESAPGEMVHA